MAQWPDLSAHGLALFVVKTEKKGAFESYLLPIYGESASDYPDEVPESIGAFFTPNAQGFLTSFVDAIEGKKLPSPKTWMDAFPGSTMRETHDGMTFSVSQKSLSDILNLPVRSPWVWGTEHEGMLETNEVRAQALSHGEPVTLCDASDVREDRLALPSAFASSAMHSITGGAKNALQDDDYLNEERKDFGEYVPGDAKETRGAMMSVDALSKKMDDLSKSAKLLSSYKDRDKAKKIIRDMSSLVMTKRFLDYHEHPQTFREVIENRIIDSIAPSPLTSKRFQQIRRYLRRDYYNIGEREVQDASEICMEFQRTLRVIRAQLDEINDATRADELFDFISKKTKNEGDPAYIKEGLSIAERAETLCRENSYPRILDSYILLDVMNMISNQDEFNASFASFTGDQRLDLKSNYIAFIKKVANAHWDDLFASLDIASFRNRYVNNHEERQDITRDEFLDFFARKTADFYYNSDMRYRPGLSYFHIRTEESKDNQDYRVLNEKLDRMMFNLLFDLSHLRNEAVQQHRIELAQGIPESTHGESPIQSESNTSSNEVKPQFVSIKDFRKLFEKDEEDENEGDANEDVVETTYRKGPATPRGDADVTESLFCETFGFRAVRYGNYMSPKQRQESLNAAFDSYSDMVKIFNLSDPKILSMPQKQQDGSFKSLAIAFGARGKGGRRAASAHYEPSEHIMNYTKRNGAGSMLHETLHAMVGCVLAHQTHGATRTLDKLSSELFEKSIFAPIIDCAFNRSTNKVIYADAFKASMTQAFKPTQNKLFSDIFEAFISERIQNRILWNACKNHACHHYEPNHEAVNEFQENLKVMVKAVQKIVMDNQEGTAKIIDQVTLGDNERTIVYALNQNLREQFFNQFYEYTGPNRVSFSKEKSSQYFKETLDAARPNHDGENKALSEIWADAVSESFWSFSKRFVNKKVYEIGMTGLNEWDTDYFIQSKLADGSRKEAYYANKDEMLARLSEVSGLKRLQAMNIENTYLVKHPDRYTALVYPQDIELETMTTMFNETFMPHMLNTLHEILNESMERTLLNEHQNTLKF